MLRKQARLLHNMGSGEREHLYAFTSTFVGLRALLALWVLVAHVLFNPIYNAGFASYEVWGWFAAIIRFDFLAVDMFFVISGILLSLHYRDRFTDKTVTSWAIDRFLLMRLTRLWPVHVAMMAVIGIYHVIGIPHPISSGNEGVIFKHWEWTGFVNLTMLHGWGLIPVASWNEPAWTVSIMMLCYIVFPNLVRMLDHVPARAGMHWIAIAVVLAAYHIATVLLDITSHTDGAGAVLRGFSLFTVGCLVAALYRMHVGLWLGQLRVVLGLACTACAAMLVWFYGKQFPIGWLHLLYAPLLLGLMYLPAARARALNHGAMRWLGVRAFCIYMVHYPVLLAIKYFAGDWFARQASGIWWADSWLYALVIASVIGVAALVYVAIERPAQHGLRRLLTAR